MKRFACILPLFIGFFLSAQQQNNLDSIRSQMEYAAKQLLIDKYYPRTIDTAKGGYLSTFTYDWQPTGDQDKMIVTQGRHVWSTSKASEFYNDTNYLQMARHGFYFLRDVMWDKQYGGFHTLMTRKGDVKSQLKDAYGNSFGMYALAAYYHASKDTNALSLAKQVFNWLELHSHDPVHKGYFQHLEINGTPVKRPYDTPYTSDLGYKDQNSSIHLLESLTELYSVWPDPLVKERLSEMLKLIRDTMVTSKGYLQLFFTPDWKPVSFRDSSETVIRQNNKLDYVSFGHDIETAYLMMEAAEALGMKDDPKTNEIAKKMVDHCLRNGWDKKTGGIYDEAYYFKNKTGITVLADTKNWWAQAEALNTLLIMSEMYPNDQMHYLDYFKKQWHYIDTYLVDHEYGDWYAGGLDKEPQQKTALKSHIWKASYHNFRSLSNCIKRLSK
jgi:mannobiose 2-epimerase